MNWRHLRAFPWLDTRARFVATVPRGGALLDLGSSDGETLRHILRVAARFAVLLGGPGRLPGNYPPGCEFQRANLESDSLRWADGSIDAITCMHLIEHLGDLKHLLQETARLLKPGGRVYFETPHPKSLTLSSPPGTAAGTFTLNFFDDRTHVRPVVMGALAQDLRDRGLEVLASGISRNWVFAASRLIFMFFPASRKKFTAQIHWVGWSAYLIARRPARKQSLQFAKCLF